MSDVPTKPGIYRFKEADGTNTLVEVDRSTVHGEIITCYFFGSDLGYTTDESVKNGATSYFQLNLLK